MKISLLIQLAGLLHVGLIGAGALMPRAVHLRIHLRPLPEFIRRLFWVYYAFIGLCLVGFGICSFKFAETLASGTPLARAVCTFFAAFWTLRLIAAAFVFDVRPYFTNRFWRLGYYATSVVFLVLPIVYSWAAWKGDLP